MAVVTTPVKPTGRESTRHSRAGKPAKSRSGRQHIHTCPRHSTPNRATTTMSAATSIVNKPARGWLHPDHLFAQDGVNYAVRVRSNHLPRETSGLFHLNVVLSFCSTLALWKLIPQWRFWTLILDLPLPSKIPFSSHRRVFVGLHRVFPHCFDHRYDIKAFWWSFQGMH